MTINHTSSIETEKTSAEYAGIIPHERDVWLENLAKHKGISSKFFYEQEGRPADPSLSLPKLDSWAVWFTNIAYTWNLEESEEYVLFQEISEEVKQQLQNVDCFIYKGTGNGKKFKAWLKIIYNVTSDEELRHAIKERHPYWITIKGQDISKEFLGQFQQTFSSSTIDEETRRKIIRVETVGEDFMTAEWRNGPSVLEWDVCCIVQLWNTPMNFSSEELSAMIEKNRPDSRRQTVYYYWTYQSGKLWNGKELQESYWKPIHHAFFLNGLKALFGKTHAHLVDEYIEIETTIEISEDQKYIRPVNNMKLKAWIESLTIPSSDWRTQFTFREGILYPLMWSTKPEDRTYVDNVLDKAYCYADWEQGIWFGIKKYSWRRIPVLATKNRVHQSKWSTHSVLAELKPTHLEQDLVYLRQVSKRSSRIAYVLNPLNQVWQSTYILLFIVYLLVKLGTTYINERNEAQNAFFRATDYKYGILIEKRGDMLQEQTIDSLFATWTLPQELEKRIEKDLFSLGYLTDEDQVRILINNYWLLLAKNRNNNYTNYYAYQYLQNFLDKNTTTWKSPEFIEHITSKLFTTLVTTTNPQLLIDWKQPIEKRVVPFENNPLWWPTIRQDPTSPPAVTPDR